MRFQLRARKHIYLLFALVAATIATIVTLWLGRGMTPYRLHLLHQESLTTRFGASFILYHDFDKDGFSESIRAISHDFRKTYYLRVDNSTGGVIDQCNYAEPISYGIDGPSLMFKDMNKDGWDEIFTFTEAEDSLFLYVHNLQTKKPLINRLFLLKNMRPHVGTKGGVFHLRLGGFIDLENESGRGLVFAAVSGLEPRGIYVFDTVKQRIVKRFEAAAFPGHVLLYDLTGDGKDEIIFLSWAVGNVHRPAAYSDQKNWLFVFDQDLSPIFAPLSFGEFPSEVRTSPFEKGKQRNLLLTYSYSGQKIVQDFMCFISPEGKISPMRYFPGGDITPPLINQRVDPPVLYAGLNESEIIKMDEELKITARKRIQLSTSGPLAASRIVDLDQDGNLEIIWLSQDALNIFDEQLRLLDSFTTIPSWMKATFRETGPGRMKQIGLNTGEDFFQFAFKKNRLYQGLPLLGVALFSGLFLMLAAGHKIAGLVFIHLSFFRHSLLKNLYGVAILDSAGLVAFFNLRATALLNLKNPIEKGQPFSTAFAESPRLIAIIEKCITTGEQVVVRHAVARENHRFEGVLRVSPFRSHFGFASAFLVEIIADTQPEAATRLQRWSAAAQKIAHDIKTPLSSLSLNLKALHMRLEALQLPNRKQVSDDIDTMRGELERVRELTRNFIRFTSLEQPRFRAVPVEALVQQASIPFAGSARGVRLEIEIDPACKEIRADARQIELVLHILLENAAEAMKDGGLIRITAIMAHYLDKPDGRFVEFEVADNGPGIDPKNRDKIFEPYFTTKPGGSGMGLAIARKIVEDHSGMIDLYSRDGLGTVIRFSLPVFEGESSAES